MCMSQIRQLQRQQHRWQLLCAVQTTGKRIEEIYIIRTVTCIQEWWRPLESNEFGMLERM